jgi:uncharacterized membrane protein YdbT with pleckstrin-like domain
MKIHTSKIDKWFYAVVVGTALLPFPLGLVDPLAFWLTLAICGGVVAFILWLYRATKYVITDDKLMVHGGLFKVDIPKSSITSVTDSRNPLSSPAFSLDRLRINHGDGKTILISPKDKSAFLGDLNWTAQ